MEFVHFYVALPGGTVSDGGLLKKAYPKSFKFRPFLVLKPMV